MKQYQKLLAKIQKIEKLLSEVKEELYRLQINVQDPKEKIKDKPSYEKESLKSDYEKLYEEFIKNNSSIVNHFVDNQDFQYLNQFCKANNISIDSSKMSKEKIASGIIQWFVQRKAISKRIQ